jgi:hypothetical protein
MESVPPTDRGHSGQPISQERRLLLFILLVGALPLLLGVLLSLMVLTFGSAEVLPDSFPAAASPITSTPNAEVAQVIVSPTPATVSRVVATGTPTARPTPTRVEVSATSLPASRTPTRTPVRATSTVPQRPTNTVAPRRPTNTVTPPRPTNTVAPRGSTNTPTSSPQPTDTPTEAPPTLTLTNTPVPPTRTRTPTPCPALTNVRLEGAVTRDSPLIISVTWTATGGCPPFTGTIQAQYPLQTLSTPGPGRPTPTPFPRLLANNNEVASGESTGVWRHSPTPPLNVPCDGTADVRYALTLQSGGRSVAATPIRVTVSGAVC